MKYQQKTINEYRKLKEGTVSQKEAEMGLHNEEPLIVCMDSLLRYVIAYKKCYKMNLADDGVLGDCYKDSITGIRGLLNGQGAVAMERNMSTDTKDNGMVEAIFWECMDEAGFVESDLDIIPKEVTS